MSGTLYIVATPIGNTGDITDRARRTLAEADVVAAEDTRTAGILLKELGIKTKLVSYHKFNEKHRTDSLLETLESGMSVAVVSDAGTPGVSDPGEVIVKAAVGRGYGVICVCGASAVTAALSVSGFDCGAFAFYGFLPKAKTAVEKLFYETVVSGGVPAAVFFESPLRIAQSLEILAAVSPRASVCLCNDLTKRYEKIYRGYPGQVLDALNENPSSKKGEYTMVVAPDAARGAAERTSERCAAERTSERGGCLAGAVMSARREAGPVNAGNSAGYGDSAGTVGPAGAVYSAEAELTDFIVKNGCTMKDAIERLSGVSGFSKNALYAASLNLRRIAGHP